MEQEKKKMGRPSSGRVWKRYTLSKEVAGYIDSLPDGERSKFVNDLLARGIAEERGIKMRVHQVSIEKQNLSIISDLALAGFEYDYKAKSNIGGIYTFISDQEYLPVDKRVNSYQIRQDGKVIYSCYPSRGEEDFSYTREDGKVVYSSRPSDRFK